MDVSEEMSNFCVYQNCRNEVDNDSEQFSFHRFPPKSNEELCKKWLLNCGLDEEFDCSRSRICSAHFKNEDFERDLKSELLGLPSKRRLKENAVPVITLNVIKQEPMEALLQQPPFLNEWRPNFILEQLAEVAVSRALSDSHFNRQAFPNSESAPVEPIENGVSQSVVSTLSHMPSSLPASQNWPGEYNFDVSFSPQEKSTKGVSWTYSKALEKLYVGKDAPCPINFSTSTTMPDDVKVRAIALYSSPESASEVVKRCVNHSLEEKSNNIFEAEHLVRCESSTTTYEIDSTTRRHSVIVPFENPPVGQPFSTYIYKFTCFGSCPFGPNRRPLMLVFTLERGMEVIGRRKIDLKICACPGRDRKSDEQQTMSLENGTSKKRKEAEFVALSDVLDFTKGVTYPAIKKAKTTVHADGLHRDGLYPDGLYHINVKDEKCFNFLIQMKKLYEICAMVKSIPPETKKAIFQMHSLKQLAPET